MRYAKELHQPDCGRRSKREREPPRDCVEILAPNWGDNLNRHANFENVLISMLTLFRCSTGESFNLVMHDLLPPDWGDNMLRCCPSCGPVVGYDEDGSPVAESSCSARMGSGFVGYFVPQFFFWVFYVLMGYIVLNGLFVGIIVDNYTNIGSENKAITVDSIEEFREAWLNTYFPLRLGCLTIPSHSLLALLQSLPPPLGKAVVAQEGSAAPEGATRLDLLTWINKLDIPDRGGRVHFTEVLNALTYDVAGVPLPLNDTTRQMQRSVSRSTVSAGPAKPTHNVATSYIATRLQQRWRGHVGRIDPDGGLAALRRASEEPQERGASLLVMARRASSMTLLRGSSTNQVAPTT